MAQEKFATRQPVLKLPSVMPDGKRTSKHPLLYLLKLEGGEINKSEVARRLGVRPQSLYKWERKCEADRNFPLPAARAAQLGRLFSVSPALFRPDVFGGS